METRDTAGNSLDVPILGMPSDNDWVLYGPFDDATLMRNVMTYELARQMGYWAPRTKYVELVINTFGWPVYQGVYVMMEKIKRDHNRVDIAKLDSTDNSGDQLTGGYIWAIDRNIWVGDSGFTSSNPQNLFFSYKYPDYQHITQPQIDYIKAYTDSFENALAAPNFADLNNGYRKYMNESSFMDFFFFQEMSKNIDAYKRSAYLNKDKYSNGGKVNAGPVWDFNSAWYNIHYCGFDSIGGWAYQMTCWISSAPVPFWYDRMLQDSIYARDLHCRWLTWRSSVLDTANIFHILDSITNYIRPAAARQEANYNLTETLQGQVDTLKAWMFWRLLWMDYHMPGNCWNLGVADESTSQDPFDVYPNPFNAQFNLAFDLASNENISIEVFDALGKKVDEIPLKNYASGYNKIILDLTNEPAGVYFVNIITENGMIAKKVLKLD
ncbi:MAG TPA: CotH kinase family protein [Bacteroidia bacterium]|nr:CotH kinase family protein [Bacteroidia bacterium]